MLDVALVQAYFERFNLLGSQVTRIKPDRFPMGVVDQWRIVEHRSSGLWFERTTSDGMAADSPRCMKQVWVPDEDPGTLLFTDERGHEYIIGPLSMLRRVSKPS